MAVVLVWEAVAASGLVSPLILPSPLDTARALGGNAHVILQDLAATLARLALGFVAGAVLGILVGTMFGMNDRMRGFSELVIDFFRSLPVITLFPLAMILFGLGNPSKIALTMWTVFLLTVVNTIYGIRQVPKTRIMAARTLRAKGWPLVWKVYIPSAVPTIIAGLRLAISLGLVVVLVTEMFTGTIHGLGKRIYDAGLVYEVPVMYAAITVAGLLGFALNKAVVFVERRIAHWSGQ